MNIADYTIALNSISPNIAIFANFPSYSNFEKEWEYYYTEIFILNYNNNKQIRLIVCESCPSGIHPNTNYIFDTGTLGIQIDCKKDKYLQQIYNGVFPEVIPAYLPTKILALEELAKQNILIIDLLPTHGIKLYSQARKKINKIVSGICDIPKITMLPNIKNDKFNYVLAVPPSLYSNFFLDPYLPKNFIEYGNLNIGQGHLPSRKTLESAIKMGF